MHSLYDLCSTQACSVLAMLLTAYTWQAGWELATQERAGAYWWSNSTSITSGRMWSDWLLQGGPGLSCCPGPCQPSWWASSRGTQVALVKKPTRKVGRAQGHHCFCPCDLLPWVPCLARAPKAAAHRGRNRGAGPCCPACSKTACKLCHNLFYPHMSHSKFRWLRHCVKCR